MKKMLPILMLGLSALTQAQSFKEQVKHEVGLAFPFGNIYPDAHAEYRTSYLFKSNQSLGVKTGCFYANFNFYIPLYVSFTQALTKNNNIRFMLDMGMPVVSYENSKIYEGEDLDGILLWHVSVIPQRAFYKRFYYVNTLFDFTHTKQRGFTFEVGLRWVFYEATDNLDKTLVVGMQPDFGFKWRIGCNKKERKAKE
jgi:hypothetical protein